MTGFEQLHKQLGVHIEPQLLQLALTHSSYAYEQGNLPNNERLEFLGDSVLGFVVSGHIFNEFHDLPEGELTKLRSAVVSAKALTLVAEKIGLQDHLMLGRDSLLLVGRARDGILADAVEAVLGAIFLSSGLDAAREVIERFVFPLLENPDALRENADPKTTLQMHCQRNDMLQPTYETSFDGPPHNRTYFAQVFSGLTLLGEGRAHSLKEAKSEAAADAVAKLANGSQNSSK
jgi:ribonuclease-3